MKHTLKSLLLTTLLAVPSVFGADADLTSVNPTNNTASTESYTFANIQEAQLTTDRFFVENNFAKYIEGCKQTARLHLVPGNGWLAGDISDPKKQFNNVKDHLWTRALGVGLLELGIKLNTPFVDIEGNLINAFTSSKYDLLTEATQEGFPDTWFCEDESSCGWFSETGVIEINNRMSNEQMLLKLWLRAQWESSSSTVR